jgi:hypothetical protein
LELCIPILAVLGLEKILSEPNKYFKVFFKSAIILLCMLISLLFFKFIGAFSFKSPIDSRLLEAYGDQILEQIIYAREIVFKEDIIRGIILISLACFIFSLFKFNRIKKNIALALFFGITIYDLGGVAFRYLDWNRFVNKSKIESPFRITNADKTILNDKTRYRVYEPKLSLTGARTAYFHNSIGGYHGAKPRRFQELYEFFNYNELPDILNILNVKYVLYESKEGLSPLINEEAQGNAWIVDSIIKVNSADDVLKTLKTIDLKKHAIIEDKDAANALTIEKNIDYQSKIQLIEESVNTLKYSFNSNSKQVVVFSEMYYPNGWEAKIDGIIVPHYRVNYVLRALKVPSGEHIISFEFSPKVVEFGTNIRYVSISLFTIILLIFMFGKRLKSNFK